MTLELHASVCMAVESGGTGGRVPPVQKLRGTLKKYDVPTSLLLNLYHTMLLKAL